MKRSFFILLVILILLFACFLFLKNKKDSSDFQTNMTISIQPTRIDVPKKEAQQEASQLVNTPNWVIQMNHLFEKSPVKNHKIPKIVLKQELLYAHKNNTTHLIEKENDVFQDSLFIKEKNHLPSILFAQCGSNSIKPDSLSQKLTTGNRKNNLKEMGSPLENINCGYIQTSFPISF